MRPLPHLCHRLPEFPHDLCFVLVGVTAPRSSTALPPPLREARGARLRAIAGRHHLAPHVCACKNPDIAGEQCQIGGRWNATEAGGSQATLFD